jgi:polar amino acid transport system substrate-binding protein
VRPAFLVVVALLSTARGTASAAPPGPESLVYTCEDIPPSNYVADGRLQGASVELLRAMWRRMGVREQPIDVVPWARGYDWLLTRKNHVLFSMSRTPQREALFKWVGPIFTVRNVLLGLADAPVRISTLDDARRYRIGVINDDVLEKYLLEQGFARESLEGVPDLELNFKKLDRGRVDLIAHTQSTFDEYIRTHKLDPTRYRVYYVLMERKNYYAFSKEVPDELIQRFQTALDASRAEQDAILLRYGIQR